MQGAGPALGSVFGGLVVDATNSWRWAMWLSAIPSGVCVLLVAFLIPETNFRRSVEATKAGMTSTQFAELRGTLRLSNRQALGMMGWYDRYASHGSNHGQRTLLTEAGKLPSGPFSFDQSFSSLFRPCYMLLSITA
jgi:MFS family permease